MQQATTESEKPKKAAGEKPETDWAKPVELLVWYLPYTIGVSVEHALVVGAHVHDGTKVSGIVRRLTHLPCGTVVARIEQDGGSKELKTMLFREGHGSLP